MSYGVLGPKGDLIKSLPISAANLPRPVMMHDFAITERWVLFLDNPLCFDGEVRTTQLLLQTLCRVLMFCCIPHSGVTLSLRVTD